MCPRSHLSQPPESDEVSVQTPELLTPSRSPRHVHEEEEDREDAGQGGLEAQGARVPGCMVLGVACLLVHKSLQFRLLMSPPPPLLLAMSTRSTHTTLHHSPLCNLLHHFLLCNLLFHCNLLHA
jgi:hypothetical protein